MVGNAKYRERHDFSVWMRTRQVMNSVCLPFSRIQTAAEIDPDFVVQKRNTILVWGGSKTGVKSYDLEAKALRNGDLRKGRQNLPIGGYQRRLQLLGERDEFTIISGRGGIGRPPEHPANSGDHRLPARAVA